MDEGGKKEEGADSKSLSRAKGWAPELAWVGMGNSNRREDPQCLQAQARWRVRSQEDANVPV